MSDLVARCGGCGRTLGTVYAKGHLRTCPQYTKQLEAENKALREAAPTSELAALENKAIEYMIDDWYEHYSRYRDDGWIDTTQFTSSGFMTGLRIIELRGLLERHPDNADWVRIRSDEDG